jgi:hypothetical protein
VVPEAAVSRGVIGFNLLIVGYLKKSGSHNFMCSVGCCLVAGKYIFQNGLETAAAQGLLQFLVKLLTRTGCFCTAFGVVAARLYATRGTTTPDTTGGTHRNFFISQPM